MGAWMVYAGLVGGLLGLAAWCIERLLRARSRPGRWVWIFAKAAALTLPVASLARPSPEGAGIGGRVVEMLVRSPGLVAGEGQAPLHAHPLLRAVEPFLLPAWVLASTLLVLALSVGLLRLRARARHWPMARVAGTEVLISDDFGPALLGASVVVPSWMLGMEAERLRLAVWHESEHRSAGDVPLILAGIAAVLLQPWNPALWWQLRRLRAAVELDCDQRVLARGAPRHAYGSLLLDVGTGASRALPVAAALSTRPSLLERRLTMIGRGTKEHGRLATGALAAAAVLAVAMACEAAPPTEPAAPAPDAAALQDGTADPAREAADIVGEDASPLIYVDGIRLRDELGLDELNPDAIERIEVIKGGAAEALFGPEASDGVIQIFLKRAAADPAAAH